MAPTSFGQSAPGVAGAVPLPSFLSGHLGKAAEAAAANDQEPGVSLPVQEEEEGVPAGAGVSATGCARRQPAAAPRERCPPPAAGGPVG